MLEDTLPHEYLALWRYNEALFTRLLFRASQESLLELLADRKYGGIKHRKKRKTESLLLVPIRVKIERYTNERIPP
ncbi:hypothetical protein D791_00769 [Nitrincola nitratireducens]|uniref:Uncharacterized protein n=1 Tax=Nitrincola nitratireducens TaxID=1229521 RepID=W9UZM4_9GAMM|nr:hypothetical protein D791_00769 [Nitrincola nitratireducens]